MHRWSLSYIHGLSFRSSSSSSRRVCGRAYIKTTPAGTYEPSIETLPSQSHSLCPKLLDLFPTGTKYSRVWNKHSPTLINFLTFFQGLLPYSGLHRAYFSSISIRYKMGYAYSVCQIFQGLCLCKGLRLFQTLEHIKFEILQIVSPSEDDKFSNVRGLYLRK